MHKIAFIVPLLLSLLLPLENKAQDIPLLLKEAHQFEIKFQDKESLNKYLEILRLQPNHLKALAKSSELHAILGRRQPSKEKQADYYNTAKSYAQHALRINSNNAEANFAMAFALGRIALISSGEERMKAVKDIRTYAERTIQLDPNHYKAYTVMGRWHYEVSNLNTVERWLLRVAYGTLPKSSLELSIRNYEKSKQLNAGFLLNYLELAKAYNRKEDERKARELLTIMMKLPPTSSNDATIKMEGKKLLEEME